MERLALHDPTWRDKKDQQDPLMKSLQQKGYAHEDALEQSLRDSGKSVTKITAESHNEAAELTLAAMASGADVIVQARLEHEDFAGFADFLVCVAGESKLGNWHYEVWDTKLARNANPSFIVQLCCYAEMLRAIQGRFPEYITVVLGSGVHESHRVSDYFAYYKKLKADFLKTQAVSITTGPGCVPDPWGSHEYGDWSEYAEELLDEKDHVSRVATITRSQVSKLLSADITTLTELASFQVRTVDGVAADTLERLSKQATLQLKNSGEGNIPFEVLPHDSITPQGLALLPPSSPLDIFFDIEGYPLHENGLEYLWGSSYVDKDGARQFKDFWAHNEEEEKIAFSDFISWAYQRWLEDPSMHIYHYANYEIAACRRLMGRYGVCEHEVDEFLRNDVFVDLYKVVKGGLLVGEPRYSIKNIEKLYRSRRDTDVTSGGDSIVVYDNWRAAWLADEESATWQESQILKDIRDYNKDDCDSTQELVEWLRAVQAENGLNWHGVTASDDSSSSEVIEERAALQLALLDRAEQLRSTQPDDKQAEITLFETLAWSLDFHRREAKPAWWWFFDRLGMSDEELSVDIECLANCTRTDTEPFKPTPRASNLVYEYSFDPSQEFKRSSREFRIAGFCDDEGKEISLSLKSEYSDIDNGLIAVQCKEQPPEHVSLIPFDFIRPDPIPGGIAAVAQEFESGELPNRAITDYLLRNRPRFKDGRSGAIVSSTSEDDRLPETISAIEQLDNSYIAIQGPPGTGKTYTATRVIGSLLDSGARVGISSNSHAAINNLLVSVGKYITEENISGALYCTKNTGNEINAAGIDVTSNGNLSGLITPGTVIGTTAWGYARDDLAGTLDYLFVDEAGQVSVVNLIAMSRSARNLVLLGDQMQLGQPIQGTHPGQSGLSVLDYLMQDQATVSVDQGIFLPTTYRMHPQLNHFVSHQFYEGKLATAPETHSRTVEVPVSQTGVDLLITEEAGIVCLPVNHTGNTQGSVEEAAMVKVVVDELLGRTLHGFGDETRQVTMKDILFVAPYNLQVGYLRQVLGEEARIGSVDKFQGQEAPIVVLSLCASDASESPRGLSFLLDTKRMNVALSRGQCLAIVVASPSLADSNVSSLRQMQLVNLFCQLLKL